MQNKIVSKFLLTSASCLALAPFGLHAQQSQPNAVLATKPEITAAATVQAADKLIYRQSGTSLTVKDLADAQRRKLEADFYKQAGFTDVAPLDPKTLKPVKLAEPIPMHSLTVLGVYGPEQGQKVDLIFNGTQQTLMANSQIGNIRIESIHPGRVELSYTKKVKDKVNGKAKSTVVKTVKPGDILEIPA
jgi:LysM repeat protein